MNGFEFNKIFASVLVALLVLMVGRILGESLVCPVPLKTPSFVIDVPDDDTSSSALKEEVTPPIAPFMAKANVAAGEQIAEKLCSQCHTFKQGEPNKTGPNLFGIVGNTFAHMASFAYSRVFQDKKDKVTWDAEKLNTYLHKPRALMPGTKMAFAGLKKIEDRANLIAYLQSLK